MNHDEAVRFLHMLRGTMIAFAAHAEQAADVIAAQRQGDEDIDLRDQLRFDFLELFYASCERESLSRETRKRYKVAVLDVLGFM